jgi:hypothetical protein
MADSTSEIPNEIPVVNIAEKDKQKFLILKTQYKYLGWLPKEDWDWIMQKFSEIINVS